MKGKEGKLESTIFKRLLKSGVWWHTLESQHLGVGGRVIETSRPVRNTRGAVKKQQVVIPWTQKEPQEMICL